MVYLLQKPLQRFPMNALLQPIESNCLINNTHVLANTIDPFCEGGISSKSPSGSLVEVLVLIEEEADYVNAN